MQMKLDKISFESTLCMKLDVADSFHFSIEMIKSAFIFVSIDENANVLFFFSSSCFLCGGNEWTQIR